MNLLVFGASGQTGRILVAGALDRGMTVTAFVRDPARLTVRHDRLRVVQGDVADRASVAAAVACQDAAISALGVARPLKPDPVVVTGIGHIIAAMEEAGVRRFIYLSTIGVGDSYADSNALVRFAVRGPLRHEIGDHGRKEDLVRASGLDWTIVRPPKMTGGRFTGTARHGETVMPRGLFPTMSRADVADFLLQQAADPSGARKVLRLLH